MNRQRSSNPFDEDYEEGNSSNNNSNNNNYNSFVMGDEHPQKFLKGRQVPLAFSSNPFQDEDIPPRTPTHQREAPHPRRSPPVSPWGSNHSPYHSQQYCQNNNNNNNSNSSNNNNNTYNPVNYQESGTITSSEMSPLLPDDLSRSYQSTGSSRGNLPSLSRRRLSVPKRIFTGSPNRPRRSRRRRSSNGSNSHYATNIHAPKPDILLTELAIGGDDHEESITMEYKYILLEDLGTAASWTILVLPYATFGFSVLLLYLGSAPVAAMGWVVTALRLSCCSVMLSFIIYWIRKMEMVRLFCGGCSSLGQWLWRKLKNCLSGNDDDGEGHSDEIYWWKNPWVLFPERYYILPLLISSLLVLEPIPVAIYFFPSIGTPKLYAIAEASSGFGIQACSLIYLCLVQGFRYHTGARSKRRAELQRKALQLQKAAKVLDEQKDDHREFVSSPRIVKNYYDEVGDMDGSTFTGHLRLPNDPCADGWADFLLPKMFLLLVGTCATTLASFTRPSAQNLFPNKTLFAVGSIVYGITLSVWTYLTLVALYQTGERLKREPFLGTRPAQLAYRILCAHSGLAIVGLGIASVEYYEQVQGSLRIDSLSSIVQEGSGTLTHPGNLSFPGMFGRLVCLTVQVAITAFIFLPPHTMDYEELGDDDPKDLTELQVLSKNRRDKRLVIHLAKDSKTWRVFPCPIQNRDDWGSSNPFQDNMFQIYKDFHTDKNTHDRGLVSIGPYIPVFCAELACWLNEASWQAYNSPVTENSEKVEQRDDFFGWMRLDVIGLQLEGYVYDERTNTQAYIATNSASQVDGEEDSIVVVAFRGTSDATNVKTDFRLRQVPLHDQITGIGESAFRVFPDRFEVSDADGWIWDTNDGEGSDNKEFVKCVGCWSDDAPPCTPTHTPSTPQEGGRQRTYSVGGMEGMVSKETADILKVAPLARNSFPMVHEGFQDSYSEIRKQLFELLLPVLQRQVAKSMQTSRRSGNTASKEPLALPKIYCTGHSLGGSLAQLFALDLASNCEIVLQAQEPPPLKSPFGLTAVETPNRFFPLSPGLSRAKPQRDHQELRLQPPIGVYTYGQPRVGNRAFSRLYKQKVPHSFRVVNEGDAFTTMPNYFFCGGHYKHAGLEVILDGGMTGNVLVGPTVVETLFRFHKVRTNVLAHQMQRYRECLECIFDDTQLLEYYKHHNIAYEELLADLKGGGKDEENQRLSEKVQNANELWMEGEITEKDGLEWYH